LAGADEVVEVVVVELVVPEPALALDGADDPVLPDAVVDGGAEEVDTAGAEFVGVSVGPPGSLNELEVSVVVTMTVAPVAEQAAVAVTTAAANASTTGRVARRNRLMVPPKRHASHRQTRRFAARTPCEIRMWRG
jgi:hypothetical protein